MKEIEYIWNEINHKYILAKIEWKGTITYTKWICGFKIKDV